MSIIGKIASLWRYPVKSMRGEEVDTVFLGFAGIYGDRFFAFKSVASPKGFRIRRGGAARHAAVSPAISPSQESGDSPPI